MDGWMVGWLMVDDSSIGVLTSWFIWGLFLPAHRYTYLATSIMIPGELHWTLAIGDLTGGREIWKILLMDITEILWKFDNFEHLKSTQNCLYVSHEFPSNSMLVI
jgi:hypothetical protein